MKKIMKNRIELAKYFGKLGLTTGAEIGVLMARYSKILFQNIPGLKLYCVDSWIYIPSHRTVAQAAKATLANYNSVVIHKASMEAVKEFKDESLDFVYIDANHQYHSVRDDITEWTKKVRKGGIVAGDDYYHLPNSKYGVVEAVNDYVKLHGYDLHSTKWDHEYPIKEDQFPNWWFVKEKMKTRLELAKYFAQLGFKRGAEIGVGKGKYSATLYLTIPNLKLIAIDSWENISGGRKEHYHRKSSYKQTLINLAPFNATVIKKRSMEAVADISDESLDFVYIDADHSYQSVKDDIREWAKKVRKGGIVSGHDYFVNEKDNFGVIKAVDEYVKDGGYTLKLTDFDLGSPIKEDRQPSWYFFK